MAQPCPPLGWVAVKTGSPAFLSTEISPVACRRGMILSLGDPCNSCCGRRCWIGMLGEWLSGTTPAALHASPSLPASCRTDVESTSLQPFSACRLCAQSVSLQHCTVPWAPQLLTMGILRPRVILPQQEKAGVAC